MEFIVQVGSTIVAITAIITGILKIVSISKLTRFEKIILTDYKKTSTKFTEAFVIVFLLSLATSATYTIFNNNARFETVVALFCVAMVYSSVILWVVFQIDILFRKRKVRYYIEDEGLKLYIHKSISDSELILSPEKLYDNESKSFTIRKREFLYDKNIKMEVIRETE